MSTSARTGTSSRSSSASPSLRPRSVPSATLRRSRRCSIRCRCISAARGSTPRTTGAAVGRRSPPRTRATPAAARRRRTLRPRRKPPRPDLGPECPVADDAAGREKTLAGTGRLRGRTAADLREHRAVVVAPDDVPACRRASEPAVQRVAVVRTLQHPAELDELPCAQVGAQRLQQALAVERQLQECAEADQLVERRAQDGLLPASTTDVRVAWVELVLADPRVDQGALPVHVLQPLCEAPAFPSRTAGGVVRAA